MSWIFGALLGAATFYIIRVYITKSAELVEKYQPARVTKQKD